MSGNARESGKVVEIRAETMYEHERVEGVQSCCGNQHAQHYTSQETAVHHDIRDDDHNIPCRSGTDTH